MISRTKYQNEFRQNRQSDLLRAKAQVGLSLLDFVSAGIRAVLPENASHPLFRICLGRGGWLQWLHSESVQRDDWPQGPGKAADDVLRGRFPLGGRLERFFRVTFNQP